MLAPHASSHLPALPPGASKLSAAKVLKVTKVLAYVAGQLPEHSIGNRPLQLKLNVREKKNWGASREAFEPAHTLPAEQRA